MTGGGWVKQNTPFNGLAVTGVVRTRRRPGTASLDRQALGKRVSVVAISIVIDRLIVM